MLKRGVLRWLGLLQLDKQYISLADRHRDHEIRLTAAKLAIIELKAQVSGLEGLLSRISAIEVDAGLAADMARVCLTQIEEAKRQLKLRDDIIAQNRDRIERLETIKPDPKPAVSQQRTWRGALQAIDSEYFQPR